ncbi:MAG: 50S ribosomal protein L3, partial [Nitrospirae bacterium CG_4_9_14_3_um_filter_51_5]
SIAGVYKRAGIEAGNFLMEFRVDEADLEGVKRGHEFSVDLFEEGQKV